MSMTVVVMDVTVTMVIEEGMWVKHYFVNQKNKDVSEEHENVG